MPKINNLAGQLQHRGTLRSLVTTQDDAGQEVESYQDFKTVWAAIQPLSGREFFAAQQVNSEVTTRIKIRYTDGVESTMIFVYGDHTFEILYIIHPEFAKRELHLMCKERQ